jgi:predicted ATPase/class 3 adenylate cyclase
MECPKCQFENREDAKFCSECGHKFELICPDCGIANRPGAKFCDECGHNLNLTSEPAPKELSFDEKIDKIQRYLPKGLTEKILSQRDRIEGERKQVTVMFCDMEGFTHLTEMDQVYELLIHKVHDYEGTVNEMTGDGLMALFGAPIALEDAPQRALRSAMAIHREMARFSDRMKKDRQGIQPLRMRVGIHTGPVVVGTLGNDLRVEFKAVGETVNLASRMEGLAEPGATYVTADTFNLTEGFFRFEALGKKELKGKKEPVNVYRVIAPSTRRTRFDVSAERGLTPFVGRERELELMLDGFERAKAGRGQALSLTAEAGIGKSRLLYEFRKTVANEDVTFLEGKCLSYSRGVAYHPVIDILKANFDVLERDEDAEIREKVIRGLGTLELDEALTLPYFLELLSVKDSGIDKIPMSPEAKKDRTMEALKQIVLKGSEIRPLILAYEDLHWVDKSSEDVLKYILESIPGARVLMLFTYRPEFVHTWGAKSFHSQLTLNRLSNRESLAMAYHLLGTDDINRDLEELILEKTEGVPFFIEEFIRSLKELEIIERRENEYHLAKHIRDLTIPSTIQDVIMARVDSLPDGAKDVLQTGSAIEREFNYELIKQVTGLTEKELISNLSALKDSELLYERGIYPQSTYIFKHALTQEVVYDSILTRRRKELHEKIGNAIEDLYNDSIDEYYEVLSEHYYKSENYEKVIKYSKLGGKKAGRTGSLNEAIGYAKKTLSSLEKLPRTDDIQKKIIDSRTILGLRMLEMNYFEEAQEAIKPIIDLALKSGYENRVSQILTIIGGFEFCIEENFQSAFEHLEEALKVSEKTKDYPSIANSNYWLAYALSLNCEFEKASYHLEKTLNFHVLENNLSWISTITSLISLLVYYPQGRINLANQTSREAIQMAEKSGDSFSKLFSYAGYGVCCYASGFLAEAINYLLKAIEFNKKINQAYWNAGGNQSLGDVYSEIGEYQTAIDHYEKAILFREQNRFSPSFADLTKIALARVKVMDNAKSIDMESLYLHVSENKVKQCEGWMQRYISEILLHLDDQHISEAENWIKKAIKADKTNGMNWQLGRDYVVYAELLERKADKSKAKANLNKAIDILKECGSDGWVKKYEEKLPSLS